MSKLRIKFNEDFKFEDESEDEDLLTEQAQKFIKACEEAWKPKPSAEQIILDFVKRYPALTKRLTAELFPIQSGNDK